MNDMGTILVVEDNLETLKMIVNILQTEGYRVLPANSGEIAVKSTAVQLPDLVLLDIRMSGIDGFEVCRRLKADDRTRQVPVIFLSAEADRSERVEVFSLGAVDFVSKPFHQEELLARVGTHLELWRLQRHLEETNSKLYQATALLQDEIAKKSRVEVELRDEREKLKDALERQIRFVDMVSHEYRTPLAIIKTNLDILREHDTDAAGRAESINYMQRAVARLVEVVEASFSVSKLAEATAETTQLERIEVADFLAEVCDEATLLWRGVILNSPHAETTTLCFILADRAQLKTALFNLIDNAVKYAGKENPINISLQNDGREICLTVADCGPVITNNELATLRQKFRRGSNTADQCGVGIGLYLVDRIVAQHEGRLQLLPNNPTGMLSKIFLPVCS